MIQTKAVGKSKHTFYVQQHFFKNFAVYEIMWKDVVAPNRPQITK